MPKIVGSFKIILPDEQEITDCVDALNGYYELAREEHPESELIPKVASRAPELVPDKFFDIKIYEVGSATADDCLMFLFANGATLIGGVGLLLILPLLPRGRWCVSFEPMTLATMGQTMTRHRSCSGSVENQTRIWKSISVNVKVGLGLKTASSLRHS